MDETILPHFPLNFQPLSYLIPAPTVNYIMVHQNCTIKWFRNTSNDKVPGPRVLAVSKQTRGSRKAAQTKWVHETAPCKKQAAENRTARATGRAWTLIQERNYTEPLEARAACCKQAATPGAPLVRS